MSNIHVITMFQLVYPNELYYNWTQLLGDSFIHREITWYVRFIRASLVSSFKLDSWAQYLILARFSTRDRVEISSVEDGFFHENPEDMYHSKKIIFYSFSLPNYLWREPTLTQNENENKDGLKNNNSRWASKLKNNNKFDLSKQQQQRQI